MRERAYPRNMLAAILGVIFVFVVTFVALALLMRLLHRGTGEPEDPETARAAAAVTVITGP